MSKILCTGSSGFIGSHLVKALEKRGDDILELKHAYLHQISGLDSIVRHFKPDYIYSLHAYGNMSNQSGDYQILQANYLATYNLLSTTKDIPYKAFINVSSSSVLLPHQTMYSATKLGAEALCKAFVDEFNKPIVTVRPFTVYGPGEADFRFIPTVFRSCLYDEPMTLAPDAVHDWVYVQDFVDAMLEMAIDIDNQKGSVINVGTGVGLTNEHIVMLIEHLTERRANITERKQMRSYDNREWKAKETDYLCKTTVQEGLEKYYDSIRQGGE